MSYPILADHPAFQQFDSAGQAQQRAQQIRDKRQMLQLAPISSELEQRLTPAWLLSDYFFQQCLRHPDWLDEFEHLTEEELSQISPLQVPPVVTEEMDEKALLSILRQYRNRWMTRLIWLDLQGQIQLTRLTAMLSEMAQVTIQSSLTWLDTYYRNLYGEALDSAGSKQSLLVIGMGKLGGGELNLSSDIDLIFAFREHGDTTGGKKSLSHQEYFTKIGQKLIQHLDMVTADGFVFRVDMRLRPYGQSGALVLNLDSLENYYQDQGRDWERYAMIKARALVGDRQDIKAFEEIRRPFVFRKYLDFSAITALRELKRMIAKEVQRKGIQHNIKLGEGGIREIEFIVQALQILRGGRDPGLQQISLYQVLPYLAEQRYLSQRQVDQLWQAYVLLRRTEHALQAIKDEQTQLLPEVEKERSRLALMLGYDTWQTFNEALWQSRHQVHGFFSELIEDDDSEPVEVRNQEAWRFQVKTQSDITQLADLTANVPWLEESDTLAHLQRFLESKGVAFMQPIGQERLGNFLASLMERMSHESDPDTLLKRIMSILESVLRRTAYLVLLNENPTAVAHLIRLCRESDWFSESIATMPMLLDDLLDANTLFSPPSKDVMHNELAQILNRLPQDDEEAQMDALRRYRRSLILRIAACDITDVLPLMKVSDHLTWLAEEILDAVLQQAWRYLVARHGYPTQEGETVTSPQMIVVGYGKSGGLELGYDSDLDLVFIHNAELFGQTSGQKSIDNLTFYTRLGQRMIHLLTSFTACGRLYEVDMRLRPSGNSGLLVTSLDAFSDYQKNEAWVWEHQALTRARVLAGSAALTTEFNQCRSAILSAPRDHEALRQEVIKMREKMRTHLDSGKGQDQFDLKQGEGGIIDIEFMVQYLVLAWSGKYPELMEFSDNIRQIEAARQMGLLDQETADRLTDTYKVYRSQAHRLTLQKQTRVVPKEQMLDYQNGVAALWEKFTQAENALLSE